VLLIAMDAAVRATNAESGVIGLLEGDKLRVMHSIASFPAGILIDAKVGIIGRALRTQQPELVLDVTTDPDYLTVNGNTRAQMTIPLRYRDRMIGVLSLETSNPDKFHAAAFDFLKLLATRITIAIDNAQLYRVSQSQLEELAQLYARVSDLEQSKTNMIRVAAHDLRNPLGLVLGYTELMLEQRDSPPEHHVEYIESIRRAGEKMLTLINDILSLERIRSGRTDQHEQLSLRALAHEVYAANADNARQKSQRYTILSDDDPLIVRGDAATLREAMTNFIHNAIKYTPPGNAITVRLERRGDLAAFEVEDTGYGIPQDQQDRLFQPFYRARTTETYQIEGTGLGLNLVKIIIEKHGGQVYFNSTYREGSLFGFELKIVADDLPDD
jgi:signal transduction histidine kinase